MNLESHVASLSLSVLICEMGTVIVVPRSREDVCEDEEFIRTAFMLTTLVRIAMLCTALGLRLGGDRVLSLPSLGRSPGL